ncbi:hypothetical protein DO021_20460 [Desulfobacter hydrogenophilus]|uniref:Uncharacterized protein n=1 Tax=Desulfobacter hydrogenophilus TaxID=2291 RepID=A0A328F942_9BACT|nr:hypothetical protein DO021_20460 [Desulfobacter hydrogenophilus]
MKNNFETFQKKTDQRLTDTEEDIKSDLESLHTDDILPSLVGLLWVTFGIAFSTMPQEIIKTIELCKTVNINYFIS